MLAGGFGRFAVRGVAAVMVLGVWLTSGTPSEAASDSALEALLDVLRIRGSINEEEYQAIRRLVDAETAQRTAVPTVPVAPSPSDPVAGVAASVPVQTVVPVASAPVPAAPAMAVAAPLATPLVSPLAAAPAAALSQADIEREVPALIGRTLSGKWYERLSLRGYTQFRVTEVLDSQGAAVEVPADRSVNANESFLIRRGRFIFSGDPSEHLFLYAQMDFNASTGAADYSLQMRDLYADVAFDKAKAWRLRLGQSKVPYGFVNLQSSQNRAAVERPDALNSAVEGERDLGAYLMWASPEARRRFRDLVSLGLKGSGDYGVVAVGGYSGQGLNRSDQDGGLHYLGRVSYPFKTRGGQYYELGVQGYTGRFVTPLQAITAGGATFTPTQSAGGVRDARVAASFVLYPQPFGIESEWTLGQGPSLSADGRRIEADSVKGGYIQAGHRTRNVVGTFFPFVRWQYFDGARKFARNAPRTKVNEVDFGLEFARWAELEITAMYTRTFDRSRTSAFPYDRTLRANRFGLQFQWNY